MTGVCCLLGKPSGRTRFTKSYKYKHKIKLKLARRLASGRPSKSTGCDDHHDDAKNPDKLSSRGPICASIVAPSRGATGASASAIKLQLLACAMLLLASSARAFCPIKCACNDLELTANCTQVSAISMVPMTLNPLLKRLTLNRLPIGELSNSLALYRQLEHVNLNANQLRQLKYENFNFGPAPKVIHLSQPGGRQTTSGEQAGGGGGHSLARNLKHSIERQLSSAGDNELRFHLRELHLADNKLEQLGEPPDSSVGLNETDWDPASSASRLGSLRAHELERLAPFLGLSRLETLDLSGNRLTRLQQHVFLGLLRLTRLDLARNQLEFVDRRALVGLVALEELKLAHNKLVRHQQQLSQLGQIICFGPLLELRQLDLSANNAAAAAASQQLVLPNQLFACAPNLAELSLRSLGLRHIQAQAFDQLRQLSSLDLSENPFDQVPLSNPLPANLFGHQSASELPQESRNAATTSHLANLRELKLSKTSIEFVNANAFEGLQQLKRLEMNEMRHLVSFDLVALVTARPNSNQNLEELHLSQNHKLQALRVSSREPVKFRKLRLLNLRGSSELRHFQLDKMLDLSEYGGPTTSTNTTSTSGATSGAPTHLELDISSSNNLNCSSCQLAWLIEAFKERIPLATTLPLQAGALVGGAARGVAGLGAGPAPTTGWSPIAFDPYNSFAAAAAAGPSGERANWAQQNERFAGKLMLLNSDLINCAWPFSMPLIELINLETNYAPLFAQNCRPIDTNRKWQQQPNLSLERATNQLAQPAQEQQQQKEFHQTELASKNLVFSRESAQTEHEAASSISVFVLIGLLLLLAAASVALAAGRVRPLLARRVGAKFQWRLNSSPSFTATTSIDDSPSSACGSSAGSQRRGELPQAPPRANIGGPQTGGSHYYYASTLDNCARLIGAQKLAQLEQQQRPQLGLSVFQSAANWETHHNSCASSNSNSKQAKLSPLFSNANGDHSASAAVGRLQSDQPSCAARPTRASGRANLFSRFAARLSGAPSGGRHELAAEQLAWAAPGCAQSGTFVHGVGTSLRFHGGRAPYGQAPGPVLEADPTSGRVRARVPAASAQRQTATYNGDCQSVGRPALVQVVPARAFIEPASGAGSNHYSICGAPNDDGHEREDERPLRARPTTAVAVAVGAGARGATLTRAEPGQPSCVRQNGASVSARKNKRRRRRLDDNHTNGHLNQLHARHDYNQLAAAAAAARGAESEDDNENGANFIYVNS